MRGRAGLLGAFRRYSRRWLWSGVQNEPRPHPLTNRTPTEGCAVSRAIRSYVGRWTGQRLQLVAHLVIGGGELIEAPGLSGIPGRLLKPSACTHLQEVIAETLVAFEGWPAGKEACPELVGAISVGEEVIPFRRPAVAESLRAGA